MDAATQKVNQRAEAEHLRRALIALIALALFFLVAGVVVFVTRAQNPNCGELKKKLDDATRTYQTVLMQSQTIDKSYMSYQSTIRKIEADLTANNNRKEIAERDIAQAQHEHARCEAEPAAHDVDVCASFTYRIETAKKRLAYARVDAKKLQADLFDNQQRLATTKATLRTANANLTVAQQDLDDANKAYAAAGCANDRR